MTDKNVDKGNTRRYVWLNEDILFDKNDKKRIIHVIGPIRFSFASYHMLRLKGLFVVVVTNKAFIANIWVCFFPSLVKLIHSHFLQLYSN